MCRSIINFKGRLFHLEWISNNTDVLQSMQVSKTCEFMRLDDKKNTKILAN